MGTYMVYRLVKGQNNNLSTDFISLGRHYNTNGNHELNLKKQLLVEWTFMNKTHMHWWSYGSMSDLSVECCWLNPRLGQTKDLNNCNNCFYKSNDLLAWSQNNVFEWGYKPSCRLLLLWTSLIRIQFSLSDYYRTCSIDQPFLFRNICVICHRMENYD